MPPAARAGKNTSPVGSPYRMRTKPLQNSNCALHPVNPKIHPYSDNSPDTQPQALEYCKRKKKYGKYYFPYFFLQPPNTGCTLNGYTCY